SSHYKRKPYFSNNQTVHEVVPMRSEYDIKRLSVPKNNPTYGRKPDLRGSCDTRTITLMHSGLHNRICYSSRLPRSIWSSWHRLPDLWWQTLRWRRKDHNGW